MRKLISTAGSIAVLAVLMATTGCKKSATTPQAGQPAAQQNPGAAPGENMDSGTSATGASTPQQNYPSAAATAAEPAPPANVTIPRGTPIRVRLAQSLNTRDTEEGQKFRGTLAAPVNVNGSTVFPAGGRVEGVVTESKSPGKFKGEGVLAIRLMTVDGTPVRTTRYEQVIKGKGKRTAGFIGGGTGLGAIIGGIAGGGKGAAIGAVSGAAAGTVGGSMTDNKEVELPAETVVTFRTR